MLAAYAFFLPVVFAGWPAFFGFPLPKGVSLYEGARIAYVLLGAAWFLAIRFRSIVAQLRPVVCRTLGIFRNAVGDRDVSDSSERAEKPSRFRKVFWRFWLLGGVGSFLFSGLVNGSDAVSDVLRWEAYSVSAFAALSALALVFASYPARERRAALRAILFGFLCANVPYSVLQAVSADPLSASLAIPDWNGAVRAFGTFGNPNSLAFFAALCLPVAFGLEGRWTRFPAVAGLLVVTALSGSVSGLAVALAFTAFRILGATRGVVWKYRFEILLGMGVFALAALPVLVPEKILSLQTRAFIVRDLAVSVAENPKTRLLGDGAGAVERIFSERRSADLDRYVPIGAPIGRGHFAFLDVAAAFGIPFALALFVGLLAALRKYPEPSARETLGIFLILWCLHTPGVGEWAMAALALSGVSERKNPA